MTDARTLPLTLDTISFAQARTLPGLFDRRCERTPQAPAYRQFQAPGGWATFTWGNMRAKVDRWKGALAREALQPGERVAIMLRNSVEWVCYDQAAQSLGLVVVPLYPTDNPGNIAYILGDCGARMLLVGDIAQWRMLESLRAIFPQLQRVVCVGPAQPAQGETTLRQLDAWLGEAPGEVRAFEAAPDALATIVYTSGTTGKPKGVMLSHRNILSNVEAVLQRVAGYVEDVYLSFLPLSHTLERTVGYYLPVMTGSTVAFARSVPELPEDLLAIRPTMLVSVPRIYERIYTKLQHQLEEKGAPARALFQLAEKVGWHRFEASQHRSDAPSAVEALMWPVLRHLVAEKLYARLGGRLRIAVSGGAPVSARLMHCFIGLGLPILQGYGLTEASPIVSANTLEDNVPSSVGTPIPGVQVRLGDRDELQVYGPNVMMGYWNDEQKTRDTIDAGGWLHTGDIGRIDESGHVFIAGRIKEILVTSTGEKVPPSDLELAISEDPLFDQVMVLGEGRPFLSAIAVLNPEEWPVFAKHLEVAPTEAALHEPRIKAAVLERMVARLADFPSYARVRDVWLTLEPWSTDNGLITPTMKLRRKQLEQRFAPAIESIYTPHVQPA